MALAKPARGRSTREGSEEHVRFVPKADSCTAAILSLFDYLGGTDKRLEGISVDKNFKFDVVQQPRPVTCVNFRFVSFLSRAR